MDRQRIGDSRLLAWLGIRHVDDALFMAAFGIWLSFILVYFYTFFAIHIAGTPLAVSRYCYAALLALSEVLALRRGQKWSKRSVIGLAVVVVLGVCCWNAHKVHMLWALPVLFCARNRDFRAIANVAVAVMASALVVTVLCAHMGVIPNVQMGNAERLRSCIGFRYPLYPSMLMFSITCLVVLLAGRNLHVREIGLLLIGSALLFMLTDSRLSFWLSVAVVALAALAKFAHPGRRGRLALAVVFGGAFVVAAAASIAVAAAYDPAVPWMTQLDAKLLGRLHLGHDGLANYGITLFGQFVRLVGNALSLTGAHSTKPYNFIDCAYLHMLILLGVVYFCVFVAAMSVATFRAFANGYAVLGFVLVVLAVHGMVDNQGLYLWCCPVGFVSAGFMSEMGGMRWGTALIHPLAAIRPCSSTPQSH